MVVGWVEGRVGARGGARVDRVDRLWVVRTREKECRSIVEE